MKNLIFIILMLVVACAPQSRSEEEAETSNSEAINQTSLERSISFLWREVAYNESIEDSISSLRINEEYLSGVTEVEKAALGYVATFVGNECDWDGEAREDRTNLKCKILTALNLGYQCSEQHLGFLRKWFIGDSLSLIRLQTNECPTTPETATIQDTFDEINIITKPDSIIVSFKASGINLIEQNSWSWQETNRFVVLDEGIKLASTKKSNFEMETMEITEDGL